MTDLDRVTRAVLSIGANLGDRLAALNRAVRLLDLTTGTKVLDVSPVYETAPVGGPQQPDYLNAVVVLTTELPAKALLARAHAIEEVMGRVRAERWGPRTIDIDVITFGDLATDDPELTVPHPRAHERAFVLAPWFDIEPDAVLPAHGAVRDLLAAVGMEGVRRRDDLALTVQR